MEPQLVLSRIARESPEIRKLYMIYRELCKASQRMIEMEVDSNGIDAIYKDIEELEEEILTKAKAFEALTNERD